MVIGTAAEKSPERSRLGRPLQVAQRAEDRAREQHGELERDRRRDPDRDQDLEAERLLSVPPPVIAATTRPVITLIIGSAASSRKRSEIGWIGVAAAAATVAVDFDQHRPHAGLDRQVVQDRAVADGDAEAASSGKKAPQERSRIRIALRQPALITPTAGSIISVRTTSTGIETAVAQALAVESGSR